MDLIPVRDYLMQEMPRFEDGVDLFVYSMPAQVHCGVVILAEPSMSHIDYYIKGLHKHRLQIIVRDSDYERGMTLANEIMTVMEVNRVEMGTMMFDFIRPRHLPIAYPRGESDEIEFSVNYDTRFVICPKS